MYLAIKTKETNEKSANYELFPLDKINLFRTENRIIIYPVFTSSDSGDSLFVRDIDDIEFINLIENEKTALDFILKCGHSEDLKTFKSLSIFKV